MDIGYPLDKDIHLSFIHQLRILHYYYFLNLDIFVGYHIFQNQISFVYLLVGYQQIWISKIQKFACNYATCQSFFFGERKICKRQHPIFKREYFAIKKNSKMHLQKKIINYFSKNI